MPRRLADSLTPTSARTRRSGIQAMDERTGFHGLSAAMAYALVLLFFFGAERRGAWSIDWLAVGYTRQRRTVPWRGGITSWAPLAAGILLLVYLGFGGERTDVGAHVAGFAVGAVLGFGRRALLGSCATRAAHPAALRRADVRPAFAGVAGCPL